MASIEIQGLDTVETLDRSQNSISRGVIQSRSIRAGKFGTIILDIFSIVSVFVCCRIRNVTM